MIKYTDGWDLTIWIGETRTKAEEIFDAIMDFITENFDRHADDEPCVLSWVGSMSPAEFDEEPDD